MSFQPLLSTNYILIIKNRKLILVPHCHFIDGPYSSFSSFPNAILDRENNAELDDRQQLFALNLLLLCDFLHFH